MLYANYVKGFEQGDAYTYSNMVIYFCKTVNLNWIIKWVCILIDLSVLFFLIDGFYP